MSSSERDDTSSDTAKQCCSALLEQMQSAQLATVGADGQPQCGYTPFLYQSPNQFFVFVSQLAAHTRDMLATRRAAIMIIQDEVQAKQLFARTRVSFQCEAQLIEKSSVDYNTILDAYAARHGKMVDLLRQLPDFCLLRLIPQSGQFVMGFGQAYRLEGSQLENFVHTRTG